MIGASVPGAHRQTLVYEISNTINGKRYIGIAVDLLRRTRQHKSSAKTGKRGKLYSAIRKYGWDSFVVGKIIECPSFADACAAEIHFIRERKPEYNITLGGEGVIGLRMTEENRRKLSARMKGAPNNFLGRKHTPATLERLRQASTGRVGYWRNKKRPEMAEFNRQRLLDNPMRYWLGKKRSEETKYKISRAKTGVKRINKSEKETAARRRNIKIASESKRARVECVYDGRQFPSAAEAALYYGLSIHCVRNSVRRQVSSAGLSFRYMRNENANVGSI